MKRSLLLAVITLTVFMSAIAQEELIPPRRSKAAKIGAVGGFRTGWLFLDTGPINDFLKAAKGGQIGTGGMFLDGGTGSAYIMVVKNLRIGGVGMAGSQKAGSFDPATGIRRDAEVQVGYGGVVIEYVVPIVERLDLVGGINLGHGGMDIVLRKSNGTMNTWEGEAQTFGADPTTTTGNVSRTLSGGFWVWEPSVSLEYAILGYLGVRVGVSYLGMSSPSWKVDDTFDLLNVPSSVNPKGVMIHATLLVGTF